MAFVRVRSPLGWDFDVNPRHAALRPDWEVIDDTPSDVQRPPTPVKKGKVSAPKKADPAEQATNDAPPVGDTE